MEDDQSRSSASVSDREMRSAEGVGSIERENQSRTPIHIGGCRRIESGRIRRLQCQKNKVDHLSQ